MSNQLFLSNAQTLTIACSPSVNLAWTISAIRVDTDVVNGASGSSNSGVIYTAPADSLLYRLSVTNIDASKATKVTITDNSSNVILSRIINPGYSEDLLQPLATKGEKGDTYTHPNHSGDVTSVGDGAQTIVSDAVTNSKLANMNEGTVKARTSSGTGDPEDITLANLRTSLDASNRTLAKIVSLTDGVGITPSFSEGNYFKVTLGGNRTMENPTSIIEGQHGTLVVKQDATGSRTLSWGSYWKFESGSAPTLTTTASKADVFAWVALSSTVVAITMSVKGI